MSLSNTLRNLAHYAPPFQNSPRPTITQSDINGAANEAQKLEQEVVSMNRDAREARAEVSKLKDQNQQLIHDLQELQNELRNMQVRVDNILNNFLY